MSDAVIIQTVRSKWRQDIVYFELMARNDSNQILKPQFVQVGLARGLTINPENWRTCSSHQTEDIVREVKEFCLPASKTGPYLNKKVKTTQLSKTNKTGQQVPWDRSLWWKFSHLKNCLDEGLFIYDVTQFWKFFDPPPPSVKPLCHRPFDLMSHFALPPLPSLRDVIYEWSPRRIFD